MDSKIDLSILDGLNYVSWVTSMETLLKSKGISQYTKAMIPNPSNDLSMSVVDGKKDEDVGLITTYISKEIQFSTSGIGCRHEF